MLIDVASSNRGLRGAAAEAGNAERTGYHAYWTSESSHDPFLPLAVAAEVTETITLGTAIALAFARSPMQMAYSAHDLTAQSEGRFILGLGSQVKAHIERRFAMPWSHPAARMREYIEALRHIWSAWDDRTKLSFAGDFYAFNLMPPFFAPPPNQTTAPIYLAAVGEQMTIVAGEVADGLLTHAFTTKRYLSEVTLPTLHGAAERAGRAPSDVAVSHLCLLATGKTEQDFEAAKDGARGQVAFYGSTPAYRPVLELHGWGGLGDELHGLSVVRDRDTSAEMASLVTDEVLEEFAIVAAPDAVSARINDRFGGLVDRLTFYTPYRIDRELLDEIASAW